ncbi:hypothetical protein T12_10813 [Trichinella patagoniensis]|uniref:Uncharacterized protein n=1 Tax=Trichinella patagoniensis TaxID=990121 RepID=A0A0V0ZKS9_9BILA|nr:hypothetical protein T12_10813 [Trichinella patagoniensis]
MEVEIYSGMTTARSEHIQSDTIAFEPSKQSIDQSHATKHSLERMRKTELWRHNQPTSDYGSGFRLSGSSESVDYEFARIEIMLALC